MTFDIDTIMFVPAPKTKEMKLVFYGASGSVVGEFCMEYFDLKMLMTAVMKALGIEQLKVTKLAKKEK